MLYTFLSEHTLPIIFPMRRANLYIFLTDWLYNPLNIGLRLRGNKIAEWRCGTCKQPPGSARKRIQGSKDEGQPSRVSPAFVSCPSCFSLHSLAICRLVSRSWSF